MKQDDQPELFLKYIRLLLLSVTLLVVAIVGICLYVSLYTVHAPTIKHPEEAIVAVADAVPVDTTQYWIAPDTSSLNNNPDKQIILYGRDLIANTAKYFGSKGLVKANAINGMNCQNCHLDAGTKIFGNNYGSVFSTYPKYRARSGSSESVYKRINDCFERSLNGIALDTTSKEMKAIAAYINWLGKDVMKGKKATGSGFKDMAFLDRAANVQQGNVVYAQKCQSCHQANGAGLLNELKTAYLYPPLWGEKSYNDGAGLYRISNFAKYVKYNMPFGVSHNSTQLTDEEAWDVAAFVNTQPRPHKDWKSDWPHIEEKPFDHPFGPFTDGFAAQQHKYGPFKPIKQAIDSLKKRKSTS